MRRRGEGAPSVFGKRWRRTQLKFYTSFRFIVVQNQIEKLVDVAG